jgi:hypothetical protein
MEMVVGYKLLNESGEAINQWGGVWGQCPAVPNPVTLPNKDVVYSMELNVDYSGYTLVEWKKEDPTLSTVITTPVIPPSSENNYEPVLGPTGGSASITS